MLAPGQPAGMEDAQPASVGGEVAGWGAGT